MSKSKKKTLQPEFDSVSAESLYSTVCDPDEPEIISLEGIGSLCESLGIDAASDVRALVLVWKLGAISKPGQITHNEFINGLKSLSVWNIDGLKTILPSLDPGFLEKSEFRDFYRHAFQFSREGTYKTLDKELVLALMPIVLDTNRAPHLTLFLEFLQGTNHQKITMDQWDSFLQFNHMVKLDLSNFEDDGAWPLLLDEYVGWRRK